MKIIYLCGDWGTFDLSKPPENHTCLYTVYKILGKSASEDAAARRARYLNQVPFNGVEEEEEGRVTVVKFLFLFFSKAIQCFYDEVLDSRKKALERFLSWGCTGPILLIEL